MMGVLLVIGYIIILIIAVAFLFLLIDFILFYVRSHYNPDDPYQAHQGQEVGEDDDQSA